MKDGAKIRKLLALALDARGQTAEADAAGLKALALARAHGVTLADLGTLLAADRPPVDERPAEAKAEAAPDVFGDALRFGIQSALDQLVGQFGGQRRRRA